jgi:hypothetical protein
MPVLGYCVVVGGVLLGLLFAANAFMPRPQSLKYASNFDGLPADYKGEPSSKRPEITPHIASITPVTETTGSAPVAEPKQAAPRSTPEAAKPATPPRKIVRKRQRQDDDGWSGYSSRRDYASSRDPYASSYRGDPFGSREPSWRDSWASGAFDQPRVSRRAMRSYNDYWSFR